VADTRYFLTSRHQNCRKTSGIFLLKKLTNILFEKSVQKLLETNDHLIQIIFHLRSRLRGSDKYFGGDLTSSLGSRQKSKVGETNSNSKFEKSSFLKLLTMEAFRPLLLLELFLKRFLPPMPPWPSPLVVHIPYYLFKNKEFPNFELLAGLANAHKARIITPVIQVFLVEDILEQGMIK